MKSKKNNKLLYMIFVVMIVFVSNASASIYPPKNAATLYYKAFMLYQMDETMNTMLGDVIKDKTEINETIRGYIKTNQKVVQILLDASEIEYCDWGINFSQGYETEIPHPFKMKEVGRLMLASAKILAQQGDYEEALMHCISTYKMGKHTGDISLICYMVGTSIIAATNDCVADILSTMPTNLKLLTLLKNEITQVDNMPFSIKAALVKEQEVGDVSMRPWKINYVIEMCSRSEELKNKILSAINTNDHFLTKSRQYWNDYMKEVIAACDLPYQQAYLKLKELVQKPSEEAKENPYADLTAISAPIFHKAFSLSIRLASHCNAIDTALKLYTTEATTGVLPDTLPTGLPGDLFSGKPFGYEKTPEGFILRCQGKDLVKDEIYEYEFKVKK